MNKNNNMLTTHQNIQNSLYSLKNGDLYTHALQFFETLGYQTQRKNKLQNNTFQGFEDTFLQNHLTFSQQNALTQDWEKVELLFQLTNDEVRNHISLFQNVEVNNTLIESYLFFAIQLKGESYTRTALSKITREINRIFPMPVMLLFQYGEVASFAMIHRRIHKKDREKDVLEKVTLLKDIRLQNPHRAHIDILADLHFTTLTRTQKITNFVELHQAWQKIFDIKELNKRFYKELFDWYLWAVNTVEFPKPPKETLDDHSYQSISVIRLLTRLIFVWFIKEKKLLNPKLFDTHSLANLLNDFSPEDSQSSAFYQGILQNLFFATLNSPMTKDVVNDYEKRQFVEDLPTFQGKNEAYNDKSKYRGKELFKESGKGEVMKLWDETPFLNGGLFECLDWREEDTQQEVRYDGFSVNKEKRAKVPNILFFGKATIDLSKELDDKKRKEVPVKGIIDILNSYKFTITENTPLEEEIALDPELLGKVFENLLASYNPETQSSARKQTGSFYTPREIVDYMVVESLKAYFKEKLRSSKAFVAFGEKQTDMFGNEARSQQLVLESHVAETTLTEEEIDDKLNTLFSYEQNNNPFDKEVSLLLIEALSDCKILDPACGSGAYPMGVLNAMTHVLTKLDPNNLQWKSTLLKRAQKDLEITQKLKDENIRLQAITAAEARIQYIKDSFAHSKHELDYTRKLFLIENCIYGVDIQQIAVQIAKLRFFISLIVEQQINENAPNRGILSMPNLETKFVAANTLIGLEKPTQLNLFAIQEITKKEKELDDIRKKIFFVKKWKDKKGLKKEEATKRKELQETLTLNNYPKGTVKQMTEWNPFDVIHSAPFFDAETMFGEDLKVGFDVVIGNPPYVQLKWIKSIDYSKNGYSTHSKNSDIYCLFYEKSTSLLKQKGVLTLITSNKWLRSDYGFLLKGFLLKNTDSIKIVDFAGLKIFENATVDTNIFLGNKSMQGSNSIDYFVCNELKNLPTSSSLSSFSSKGVKKDEIWGFSDDRLIGIKERIEQEFEPLQNLNIQFNYGILTGSNKVFILDETQKETLLSMDKSINKYIVPIIRGRDLEKYSFKFNHFYLLNIHNGIPKKGIPPIILNEKNDNQLLKYLNSFGSDFKSRGEKGSNWYNLRSCAYIDLYLKPKILYTDIVQDTGKFYLDLENYYTNDTAFMIYSEDINLLKYLTGVLNSKVATFFYINYYCGGFLGNKGIRYKKEYLQKLPVPLLSPLEQQPFIRLVEYILWLKKQSFADIQDRFMSVYFEQVIDGMVYELYFTESFQKHNKSIIVNLGDLPEISAEMPDNEKLAIIRSVFHRLDDKKHPVRNHLFYLDSIPEVALIMGKQS